MSQSAQGQGRRRRRSSSVFVLSFVILLAVAVVMMARSHNDVTGFARTLHLKDYGWTHQNSAATKGVSNDEEVGGAHDNQEKASMCFEKFPWINRALDVFFTPVELSAVTSNQTTDEALEAMANITWYNGYHPGHDLVTLRYNPSSKGYDMEAVPRFPANRHYKRDCILKPLRSALSAHGPALAKALGRKDLRFVVETEDFGMVWRGLGFKLPPFAMCTDSAHIDIPVPDFTYGCYPETHYTNSSWPAIAHLLESKAAMLPWKGRNSKIFHRGHWGVGPRRGLMPFLMTLVGNHTDESTLGAPLDIADTGFIASNKENFVWLDEQCAHKVAIHTAGFSYSAALKYKLACGSLVLRFESDYTEFYEPGLVDGTHVVSLKATHEGVDEEEFTKVSAPKIKEAVQTALNSPEAPAIAQAGQKFALEQLSPEALDCYWYGVLIRYSKLYFMEPKKEVVGGERVQAADADGKENRRRLTSKTSVGKGNKGEARPHDIKSNMVEALWISNELIDR